MRDPLFDYTLRLGDDALVLGQKLSQWCGHAPCLEVDLGLSSLALDLVGQGTDWLQLAAKLSDDGRDADTLAFGRNASEFRNSRLVGQPNGDFAQTLARQFLFSNWQLLVLEALSGSSDKAVADIATRAARDVTYHVAFARDWMIRLGDGACLSHQRLIKSLDDMAGFIDELFVMDDVDEMLLDRGIAVDRSILRTQYDARIMAVLQDAGLTAPRPAALPTPAPQQMQFNSRAGDLRWGF